MSYDEGDQDGLSHVLQTRRIPHGRSRNNGRGGKGSARKMFDPLRAIGVYDVSIGAKKPKHTKEETTASNVSQITIHGLTDDETGLFASLKLAGGVVTGMGILAGSRKGLKEIITQLEEAEEVEQETSDGADEEEPAADHDAASQSDEDNEIDEPKSAMEAEDDKINRRARAFEKNSFRNPKFWIRWKAQIRKAGDSDGDQAEKVESNTGYIIFSGNDCATFEGTMTSEILDWDNIRIKGHKVKSHAGQCPMAWTDF